MPHLAINRKRIRTVVLLQKVWQHLLPAQVNETLTKFYASCFYSAINVHFILDEMLRCTPNKDLSNIFTIVKGDVFAQLLKEANYDTKEIEFLHSGFVNGFDLGYRGPSDQKQKSANMPLRCGTKFDLWNEMIKEVIKYTL